MRSKALRRSSESLNLRSFAGSSFVALQIITVMENSLRRAAFSMDATNLRVPTVSSNEIGFG